MGTHNALVLDIYHVKWGKQCPARNVARRVYDKIDSNLRHHVEKIVNTKRDASSRRHPLAHPAIPDARVTAFLKDLEDENPVLNLLEIAAFNHIKSTANSDANIREANCGYN
jgi:uncharacterized protein YgbK (DUF1537 family)